MPDLNLEAAKERGRRTSCTEEDDGKYTWLPYCGSGPNRIGSATGSVGLELYFRFLKGIGCTMFLMSLLLVPLLYACLSSGVEGRGILSLASTTVANLGNSSHPVSERTVKFVDFSESDGDANRPLAEVVPIFTFLDALGGLVMILFALIFRKVIMPYHVRAFDERNVTPADYALQVEGLPRQLKEGHEEYENRLATHFANVLCYERTQAQKNGEVSDCPVMVSEVSLVRDFDGNLRTLKTKADLEDEIAKAEMEGKTDKVAKLKKKKAKVEEVLQKKGIAKEEDTLPVCRGFVVVGSPFDKSLLLNAYRFGRFSLLRCNQSKRLRFEGRGLKVSEAPEPSNILWPNQDIPKCEIRSRKVFTLVVSLLIMVLSIALIFYTKIEQENFKLENALDNCTATPLLPDEALLRVENCTTLDSDNGTRGRPNDGRFRGGRRPGTQPTVNEEDASSFCSPLSDCDCKKLGLSAIYEHRKVLLDPCRDWVNGQAWLMGITALASILVIIVNFVLRSLLIKLAEQEKPQSISQLQTAIVSKVFVAQFANTALVVLLVNATIFGGVFDDFTDDWYQKVGVAILLTMLINVVSPHCVSVVRVWLRAMMRCCCKCRTKDQESLERLYENPDFTLAANCGQLLNTMFCTLIYSAGLPLLLPFATITVFLVYWCDKFVLLRGSKRTPAFDQSVVEMVVWWIVVVVLVHAGFAIWMYGMADIFPVEPSRFEVDMSDYGERVQDISVRCLSKAGLPLFLLFLAALSVLLFRVVNFILGTTVGSILNILCAAAQGCTRGGQKDAADEYTFEQAVKEFGQQMLFSYHRSAHPDYKAIDDDGTQPLKQPVATQPPAPVVADVEDEPTKESGEPQRTQEELPQKVEAEHESRDSSARVLVEDTGDLPAANSGAETHANQGVNEQKEEQPKNIERSATSVSL
jgi:hypothetical protein